MPTRGVSLLNSFISQRQYKIRPSTLIKEVINDSMTQLNFGVSSRKSSYRLLHGKRSSLGNDTKKIKNYGNKLNVKIESITTKAADFCESLTFLWSR